MEPALLAAIAAAILAFGALSRKAERSIVTPPIFFVLVGAAIGEHGLGWVDFGLEHSVLDGLVELTLVVVLFTDAARIDLACLRREESIPVRMLGIGMPLTIGAGALAAVTVFPEFTAAQALLLAAILAPTDAALGQAVVSSPTVPLRIRQSLNVESGLNDGIALPVVLVVAVAAGAVQGESDFGFWARFVGLQLVLGPIVGIIVGWVGGQIVERATRDGWMNDAFQRLSALGIAGLAFGAAGLVGGNGFIAAFVAGLTLGNTARSVCDCLHHFGEAEGQLLTLLVFVFFGGAILPEALAHANGQTFVYALLSLTVVRMVPVALSLVGTGLLPASLAFLGWFGPRGLASIVFALLVVEQERLTVGETLETVVMVTVFLSTLAHGVTAYPAARAYGRMIGRRRASAPSEHGEAMDLPVRISHAAHEG